MGLSQIGLLSLGVFMHVVQRRYCHKCLMIFGTRLVLVDQALINFVTLLVGLELEITLKGQTAVALAWLLIG